MEAWTQMGLEPLIGTQGGYSPVNVDEGSITEASQDEEKLAGGEESETLTAREARRRELEAEFSYDGYKYVRKEVFPSLRDPSVTIRDGSVAFNAACIRDLDCIYVNIMFNEQLCRMVVHACDQNDKDAVRWCTNNADKRKSRQMRCPIFTDQVYKLLKWDKGCRYKILGYKINFEGEDLYIFDLKVQKVFQVTKKTKKEDNTQVDRKGYYPDDIMNSFGVPVEEHDMDTKVTDLDGFVSYGMITGNPAASTEGTGDSSVNERQTETDTSVIASETELMEPQTPRQEGQRVEQAGDVP